jgi:hypothetical protein
MPNSIRGRVTLGKSRTWRRRLPGSDAPREDLNYAFGVLEEVSEGDTVWQYFAVKIPLQLAKFIHL